MDLFSGTGGFSKGFAIEQIQECFDDLGYVTDWRIMNAAHFGVPQKRERLVMIGAQNGIRVKFPSPTHTGDFKTIGIRDRSRLILPPARCEEPTLFANEAQELPEAVTVMEAIGDLPPVRAGTWVKKYHLEPQNSYQTARRQKAEHLEWHVATAHTKRMIQIIRHAGSNINSVPKHLITSGFSSCYSRLDPDQPSVTLTVNFVHPASNKCIHPLQDRALTLREGARLQSFDDDFQFSGTRTQIAKQIGNAVPPLLGQVIAEAILQMLYGLSSNTRSRSKTSPIEPEALAS